jgi:hypothetical protein
MSLVSESQGPSVDWRFASVVAIAAADPVVDAVRRLDRGARQVITSPRLRAVCTRVRDGHSRLLVRGRSDDDVAFERLHSGMGRVLPPRW